MVYFARVGTDGPIKIGCSAHVRSRLHSLSSHLGRQVILLRVMEGGIETESEIHKRFAHLRLDRWHNPEGRTRDGRKPELFRPEADLMEFIEALPEIDRTKLPLRPKRGKPEPRPWVDWEKARILVQQAIAQEKQGAK